MGLDEELESMLGERIHVNANNAPKTPTSVRIVRPPNVSPPYIRCLSDIGWVMGGYSQPARQASKFKSKWFLIHSQKFHNENSFEKKY